MADELIRLTNIAKTFNRESGHAIRVFEDFSLSFASAEITAILGPTGCGKSTLLSIINGLVTADGGTIRFPSRGCRPKIGTVLQKDLLLPWRKVRANMLLGAEISRASEQMAVVDKVALEVGLANELELYPYQLSGGTSKKVSLARTLLFSPDIVLFDEPFANIDYYHKLELEKYCIEWLRMRSSCALFVTHDIEEAIAVSDRIVVLSEKPARVLLDFRVERTFESKLDPILARKDPQSRRHFDAIWRALEQKGVGQCD